MKTIVKKKANPAFKRLQRLPLLSDLSLRSPTLLNAAAPAFVIIATGPESPAAAAGVH